MTTDNLPGVKQSELANLGKCAICKKTMLSPGAGLTIFRLRAERIIWDMRAIQRQVGLEMQLGSPMLASVMGPDEDLAKIISGPIEIAIHESCTDLRNHGSIGLLLMMAFEAAQAKVEGGCGG